MESKISVLVVEDETSVRKLLVRVLSERGREVKEAADGLQALRLLRRNHSDIVVSDIAMPRLNGLELLRDISTRFPDTSVILITGHPFEYAATDAIESGVEHILLKPFKNSEFMETFDSVVSERSDGRVRTDDISAVETEPRNHTLSR
jgi:putative two-component system response regulator